MAKKSHEQFVKELEERNPKVIAIGIYTGARNKMEFKCKACGNEWDAQADSVLRGTGCPKCGGRQRLTQEEFESRVKQVCPNVIILGEYKSTTKKVECECVVCNHRWSATPNTLFKGIACPECYKRNRQAWNKKTHEQFVKDLSERNPSVLLVGTYVDSSTKTQFACKECGYEWSAQAQSVLTGTGCPKCAGNMRLTQDEFESRVADLNPQIIILGKYTSLKTKVECQCGDCGNIWETTPATLFKGRACPECGKRKNNEARTKTHDQFIKELSDRNPKVISIGMYNGSCSKTDFRCKACGYEWNAQASSVLSGSGCPKCAGNIKITHNEFIHRVSELSPNTEVLGKYVNAKTKVLCRCKICGVEWNTEPGVLYNGSSCPECGNKKIGDKLRKTHDEFVSTMTLVNCSIEICGKYHSTGERIECRCRVCSYEWKPLAGDILSGRGCPKCAKEKVRLARRNNPEDVYRRVEELHPTIITTGAYHNNRSTVECVCKLCNHEWTTTYAGLLAGHGCRRCHGGQFTTADEFISKMGMMNPGVLLPDGFKKYGNKIRCICAICDTEFYDSPSHLLSGRGCPLCRMSSGEKIIAGILTKHSIPYKAHVTFPGLVGVGSGSLSYDFLISDCNILIEVQGAQHAQPIDYFGGEEQFAIQQIHDGRKKQYADEHGYKLLYIWYDELNDAQSKILSLINEARNDHSYASDRVAYAGISM